MSAVEHVAKWAGMPYVGFDTETTGVNAHTDRIVQAAVVYVEPDKRPVVHTWLINPGIQIPDEAAAVHGITTERAEAEGVDPGVALFEIAAHLGPAMGRGRPVVAFNAAYDLTIFEAECRRHKVDTLGSRVAPKPVGPIIDPFVIDKQVSRRKGKRKLTDVCGFYGVVHGGAHDAAADALAAVRLVPRIVAKFPEAFRGMTVGGLHQAQVGWRREQMISLRRYFEREGIGHDGCDPSWPLLMAPAVVDAEVQGALL